MQACTVNAHFRFRCNALHHSYFYKPDTPTRLAPWLHPATYDLHCGSCRFCCCRCWLCCCILRYVIVNFKRAGLNVNDERPNCLIDITTGRRRAVSCVQRCHATCHLPHATLSVWCAALQINSVLSAWPQREKQTVGLDEHWQMRAQKRLWQRSCQESKLLWRMGRQEKGVGILLCGRVAKNEVQLKQIKRETKETVAYRVNWAIWDCASCEGQSWRHIMQSFKN